MGKLRNGTATHFAGVMIFIRCFITFPLEDCREWAVATPVPCSEGAVDAPQAHLAVREDRAVCGSAHNSCPLWDTSGLFITFCCYSCKAVAVCGSLTLLCKGAQKEAQKGPQKGA